jgi:hypothetical protein
LSWGSEDVPVLLAEVTHQETTADVEAAHAATMLVVETSAWEAAALRDSAALRVKDAEDRAALAAREELERVLRAEAENTTALSSAREDAKGLAREIALLRMSLQQSVGTGRCLRGSAMNNSRGSPFFRLVVPSCVIPSLVPHG